MPTQKLGRFRPGREQVGEWNELEGNGGEEKPAQAASSTPKL